MKTFHATKKAREEIAALTGKAAENIVSCDRDGALWTLVIEIVETKARISDNDVIAVYELTLDDASEETVRYRRLRRYARCAAAETSAA